MNKHLTAGYTLIEVLMAILVMSIGLAGLGVMQVLTVQNTYNANNRALAVMASESMSDLVRSNLRAYEFGVFSNHVQQASVIDCGVSCTPEESAQNDIALWQLQIARLLPQGRGILCMDGSDGSIDDGEPGNESCSGAGQNVIKIFWRENISADGAADNAESNRWGAFGTPLYP